MSVAEPLSIQIQLQMRGTRHRTTRKRKPDDVDDSIEKSLAKLESDSLGPFWFHKSTSIHVGGVLTHVGLQQRERLELNELIRREFCSDDFLRNKLVPLNDESSTMPRLRMYNWAVTNFAKCRGITTQITDEDGKVRRVDPCISYDGALKRLHRTLFDPYRRGTLLFFKVDDEVHHTTVGQLLFVKWCMDNGVDKYVTSHEAEIREHLNLTTQERAGKGSKRVRELTEAKLKYARVASVKKARVEEADE